MVGARNGRCAASSGDRRCEVQASVGIASWPRLAKSTIWARAEAFRAQLPLGASAQPRRRTARGSKYAKSQTRVTSASSLPTCRRRATSRPRPAPNRSAVRRRDAHAPDRSLAIAAVVAVGCRRSTLLRCPQPRQVEGHEGVAALGRAAVACV